jgi:tRNA1Val (adenine37-N6)-methyltransferase
MTVTTRPPRVAPAVDAPLAPVQVPSGELGLGRAASFPKRREGPAKLTGAALYTDDMVFPGAWFGHTVRSTEAHARLLGIELDPELVALANENAARNGVGTRVRFEAGDAAGACRHGTAFDHVFFNPPFHPASGQESPFAARDRAMRDPSGILAGWTRIALSVTKAGGTVTAILRADRAEEMLAVAEPDGTVVFALFPRAGEPPKRAILQIVKGVAARPRVANGLILHHSDGRNTDAAEAVLRHGAALRLD